MAEKEFALIDGSRLIVEALARAGADVFIGYPITPANLLYAYSSKRFPTFFAAPDEITTLQWMTGFSAAGRLPVTATSFPGFALMIESVNMAYMMELPMVIVLVQRLGPATGTATCGAQGDLSLLAGMLSGGYSLPVFSTSNSRDCWDISELAVKTAVKLRTPVVLLTSKEEVMTQLSFDLASLKVIEPVNNPVYNQDEPYLPYKAKENLVPEFLAVSNNFHQVRITASTHDSRGIIQNTSKEAIDNTKRLQQKMIANLPDYTIFELDEVADSKILLVSWGITAQAARESLAELRKSGKKISLLIPKILIPVVDLYLEVIEKYENVVFAEENYNSQLKQLFFGQKKMKNITSVTNIGKMITPAEIIKEVMNYV